MFWGAVVNGLKVLLHWQTYVVAVMYIIISFLPVIALMVAGNKSDDLMAKGGCLVMLIQPLFQALAVLISVCTLFPIMLGRSEAAWSLPWLLIMNEPGRTLILLVIMLVISIIGAFIPILGRANSFIMFIMGGVVVAFLTLAIHKMNPELGINNMVIIPGFFTIIGIVLVSGIASWLGMLASAAVVTLLFRGKEDISQIIMVPLGSVFGFIPVFIYAAWIGLQIKGLR
jgi:hypothetical protein